MTRKEAAKRLREIAYEMYNMLEEMKEILRRVAPEELETAEVYWMARIDGALLNRRGWMGRSFINLADTLTNLGEELGEEDEEV